MSATIFKAGTSQEEGPQGWSQRCCRALPGEGSQAQSPRHSPTRSHQWVTFQDPEVTSEEDQAAGQSPTDLNLGSSLKLGLDIDMLPTGASHHAGRGGRE